MVITRTRRQLTRHAMMFTKQQMVPARIYDRYKFRVEYTGCCGPAGCWRERS